MGRGRPKKTVAHHGVIAEVEEEDLEEISIVDRRQKTQNQPAPEKYWTANCIEAEDLVNKGVKLLSVLSAFGGLPKRWVFDSTKDEIANLK